MHLNTKQLFNNIASRYFEKNPALLTTATKNWLNDNPGSSDSEETIHSKLLAKTAGEVAPIFNRLNDIMSYAALAPLTAYDAGYSLQKLDLAAQILALEADRSHQILRQQNSSTAEADKAARKADLGVLTVAEIRSLILAQFPQARP
jgi:hypothetical protein